MRSLLSCTVVLLTSVLLSFTTAQSSNNASAVFVYNGSNDAEFVFAVNVDESSGDVYFHLSSPAGNAWVGVGIGDQMKDALMLIAYPADNGNAITLSPRIGAGHTEPAYSSDVDLVKVEGVGSDANTVSGNDRGFSNIVADGVCKQCTQWNGGALDVKNKAQPFIFAVGPTFPTIDSASQSAGLSRHSFYGSFTMDMTAATSTNGGTVPAGPYTQKHASSAITAKEDNDPAPRIHGLVMSFVFIIAFPVGSLLLRVWNTVKGHIIMQSIGTVLFCMAFAGGCVVSTEYIRSKNFNSAHQVIGILLLLAILGQFTLGLLHHRIYKREQRKTIMGKIHLYLGPAVIGLGWINGALGFGLAGVGFLALPYAIIVIVFAAVYLCIRVGVKFYRRRKAAAKGPEGYQYPQFGGQAQPAGASPAGYPPPYSQDVPLTRFASSQSVSRMEAEAPPVQTRPMV